MTAETRTSAVEAFSKKSDVVDCISIPCLLLAAVLRPFTLFFLFIICRRRCSGSGKTREGPARVSELGNRIRGIVYGSAAQVSAM
jgi:hypothetical protein